MSRAESIYGVLALVFLGIVLFLALAHFAACEQDDAMCAITWEDTK